MDYTQEQVLSLPAGRMLDTVVARNVMYWKVCGDNEPFRFHKEAGGLIFSTGPEVLPAGSGIIPRRWEPSADMAAAWQVVEQMESRGYTFSILNGAGGNAKGWRAEFMWGGLHTDSQLCETAALAICRAALLALLETASYRTAA